MWIFWIKIDYFWDNVIWTWKSPYSVFWCCMEFRHRSSSETKKRWKGTENGNLQPENTFLIQFHSVPAVGDWGVFCLWVIAQKSPHWKAVRVTFSQKKKKEKKEQISGSKWRDSPEGLLEKKLVYFLLKVWGL